MITRINESNTLTKHISCKCKCRFNGEKCSSDQWWKDKCWCNCRKRRVCEKDHVWNPSTCNWENGKYLASIIDDAAIMCDEVIESYDKETNFDEKKATYKRKNFYILLAFF